MHTMYESVFSIFLSENIGMIRSKQQQWEGFNNNNAMTFKRIH
jgi:hypothetical protein